MKPLTFERVKTPLYIIFFSLLCVVVSLYNHQIFHYINRPMNEKIILVMYFFTALVDGVVVIILGSLFYRFSPLLTLKMFLALLLISIIVHVLKEIFSVERPLKVFGDGNIRQIGMPLYHFSFPSGHSAASMVFARFLIEFFKHKNVPYLVWPALLFGIVGGLSRIAVGAHFPLDVLVGGVLGYCVTDIVFKIEIPLKKPRLVWQRVYVIFFSAFGLFAVFYYIVLYPEKYFDVDFVLQPFLVLLALAQIYVLIRYLLTTKAIHQK